MPSRDSVNSCGQAAGIDFAASNRWLTPKEGRNKTILVQSELIRILYVVYTWRGLLLNGVMAGADSRCGLS